MEVRSRSDQTPHRFAKRLRETAHFADPTADRLIEILRMAREVGGTELPSVLRDLGLHLRQDLALRSEVQARQSWVTNAGKLGIAAPWIVLALLATRPEAAAAYATPAGTVLVIVASALAATVIKAVFRDYLWSDKFVYLPAIGLGLSLFAFYNVFIYPFFVSPLRGLPQPKVRCHGQLPPMIQLTGLRVLCPS